MSLPYVHNPFLMNAAVVPAAADLMPLKLLIRQAGVAGGLLLTQEPLGFLTIRGRTEGYDSVDGSAMIQILYAVLCFLYAARYLTSPQNRGASRILTTNPVIFFLLYIILCGVSALWSPKPTYTAFMAFQCLAFLMLVVAALSEVNRRCSPQDVIEWAMFWIVWTIFWAVIRAVHWYGLAYLLYPFGSGRLATGIFFFLALYLCKRRPFGWLVVAFGVLSLSNKNYFGILPSLLLAAWLGDRKAKILAFIFAVALTISILLLGAEEVIQNTLFYGKEGVGWEYTTGRDKVWQLGWDLGVARPITGYGFVTGERQILYETRGPGIISMHNGFLSAFIGVGVVGIVLLASFFLGAWIMCLSKTVPPPWRFAFTATILMVFVVSMTGPGLGGRVYGAWVPSVVAMTTPTVLCARRVGVSAGQR